MEELNQASGTQMHLFTDPAHGNPVQVMHDSHGSDELVAVEAARKEFGDRRLEHFFALGAIRLAEPVEDATSSEGSRIDYESLLSPLILQRTPTMRTLSSLLGVHIYHLVGFRFLESFPACSLVSGLGALGLAFCALIGFQRDL